MKHFPPDYFYHLAEPSNLPSIRRHGLLSAERLMKLAKMRGAELQSALRRHRADSLVLANGIIIRDQSPMPPRSLARALPPGITPPDWYRFLNGFVFLWANKDRVDRHLVAFRERPQALLILDAPRLIDERGDDLFLSPINSGNAMRSASPRSYDLFVPYRVWRENGWPAIGGSARSKSAAPAEIVIKDRLALEPYLVEIREPTKPPSIIQRRPPHRHSSP